MRAFQVISLPIKILLVLVLSIGTLYSQDTDTIDAPRERQWHIRPKISVGVGMLNYQGDIIAQPGYFNPFQNRTAIHVNAAQSVNSFLDLNFYMLYGSLLADERTLVRNLNFKSRITAGGVAASYNFDHLLNQDRKIEPFISLGFEVFEFQTKTDLIDSYGNTYNYWSDGTIRNVDENAVDAVNAIEITRDYVYETDVRELNRDGFGDYAERSFAIPVGAGFNLHMNEKMSFKMGLEYHWTFTDYIDGITPGSRTVRQGNPQTDRFLHTFARLTYDLTPIPHEETPELPVGENDDTDLDSIPDFLDDCPNTPLSVEVDDKGCPLDGDGDGVADYMDSELDTPEGAPVDSNGIALTDEVIEELYLEWTDASGRYSQYTNNSYSIETSERKTRRRSKGYTVRIASMDSISDSVANILLSNPNVTTRETDEGETIIEMAGIKTLEEALQVKLDLEQQGIATVGIVEMSASGKESDITTLEEDIVATKALGLSVEEAIAKNKGLPRSGRLILNKSDYTLDRPIDERSVARTDDSRFGGAKVYRVQIGAYANKLSNDIFTGIPDLVVVTTEDGLTRYYVGASTSYQEAASRKIDMIEKGFYGSYVATFLDGKREALGGDRAPEMSKNFGSVKFKVQIGSYSGEIPTDVLNMMMEIGRIDQRDLSDGQTLYLTGEFNTVEDARSYQDELLSKGFQGAVVVGENNGQIISAEEVIELLNR